MLVEGTVVFSVLDTYDTLVCFSCLLCVKHLESQSCNIKRSTCSPNFLCIGTLPNAEQLLIASANLMARVGMLSVKGARSTSLGSYVYC
jgi:hypothetical protein